MTLVMAGFTAPNAVHPPRGKSASCFASKACVHSPAMFGLRKLEARRAPALPDYLARRR